MQTDIWSRPLDIEVSLTCSTMTSQYSERASYKPLYTRRVVIDAKQGLTNQCRRRRLGHSFFAAHDRYRLRLTRRGITVSRVDAADSNPPQRRLYADSTVSRHERRICRGYDGLSRPSAPNSRAMKMADTQVTHTFRHTEAQSAQKSRDQHNHSQQTNHDAAADPAVLARHRRAHAQIRGAKAVARRREREEEVIRRADNTEHTGSGTGDHRREVV
jgi:hypothetical protein